MQEQELPLRAAGVGHAEHAERYDDELDGLAENAEVDEGVPSDLERQEVNVKDMVNCDADFGAEMRSNEKEAEEEPVTAVERAGVEEVQDGRHEEDEMMEDEELYSVDWIGYMAAEVAGIGTLGELELYWVDDAACAMEEERIAEVQSQLGSFDDMDSEEEA